jgi:hypothetical protein
LSRDENLTMRYLTAALFSLLSGCAAIQALEAADSEEILAEAGFHRQSLDEPGLPSRQLVAQAGMYKFADPDFCVCMYIGGEKEYAELQRLRAERIAERDWALRHNSSGNAYLPIVWGPWRPEGLDLISAPTSESQDRAAAN